MRSAALTSLMAISVLGCTVKHEVYHVTGQPLDHVDGVYYSLPRSQVVNTFNVIRTETKFPVFCSDLAGAIAADNNVDEKQAKENAKENKTCDWNELIKLSNDWDQSTKLDTGDTGTIAPKTAAETEAEARVLAEAKALAEAGFLNEEVSKAIVEALEEVRRLSEAEAKALAKALTEQKAKSLVIALAEALEEAKSLTEQNSDALAESLEEAGSLNDEEANALVEALEKGLLAKAIDAVQAKGQYLDQPIDRNQANFAELSSDNSRAPFGMGDLDLALLALSIDQNSVSKVGEKFSIKLASLATEPEPDPSELYLVRVDGERLQDRSITVALSELGYITSADASAADKGAKFAVDTVKSVASLVGTILFPGTGALGFVEDRDTRELKTQKERLLRKSIDALNRLHRLREQKSALLSPTYPHSDVKSFERVLKELNKEEIAIVAYFEGATEIKTLIYPVKYLPTLPAEETEAREAAAEAARIAADAARAAAEAAYQAAGLSEEVTDIVTRVAADAAAAAADATDSADRDSARLAADIADLMARRTPSAAARTAADAARMAADAAARAFPDTTLLEFNEVCGLVERGAVPFDTVGPITRPDLIPEAFLCTENELTEESDKENGKETKKFRLSIDTVPHSSEIRELISSAATREIGDPRGFYYRVPAQAEISVYSCEETKCGAGGKAPVSHDVFPIPQLGVTASLPSDMNSSDLAVNLQFHESLGSLKKVVATNKALDLNPASELLGTAQGLVEARQADRAARKAEKDELAILQREADILEAEKKKLEFQDEIDTILLKKARDDEDEE